MAIDLQQLRLRVQEKPDNLLAQFSFAQALFQNELYAEAIGPLQTCAEGRADWMLARILLGKCYRALGKKPEAIACFRQALDLAIAQEHEDPARELTAILTELQEAI